MYLLSAINKISGSLKLVEKLKTYFLGSDRLELMISSLFLANSNSLREITYSIFKRIYFSDRFPPLLLFFS